MTTAQTSVPSVSVPSTISSSKIIFKFHKELDKMTEKQQKQYRGKMRTILFKHIDAIIFNSKITKKEDKGKIEIAINEFLGFYKGTYILNDLSVSSCYTASDQTKIQDLTNAFDIIKKYIAKREKEEKKEMENKEETSTK